MGRKPMQQVIEDLIEAFGSIEDLAAATEIAYQNIHRWRGGKSAPNKHSKAYLDNLLEAFELIGVDGLKKVLSRSGTMRGKANTLGASLPVIKSEGLSGVVVTPTEAVQNSKAHSVPYETVVSLELRDAGVVLDFIAEEASALYDANGIPVLVVLGYLDYLSLEAKFGHKVVQIPLIDRFVLDVVVDETSEYGVTVFDRDPSMAASRALHSQQQRRLSLRAEIARLPLILGDDAGLKKIGVSHLTIAANNMTLQELVDIAFPPVCERTHKAVGRYGKRFTDTELIVIEEVKPDTIVAQSMSYDIVPLSSLVSPKQWQRDVLGLPSITRRPVKEDELEAITTDWLPEGIAVMATPKAFKRFIEDSFVCEDSGVLWSDTKLAGQVKFIDTREPAEGQLSPELAVFLAYKERPKG